jgi:hypothetical protein
VKTPVAQSSRQFLYSGHRLQRSGQSAFTILEVLIAAFVLLTAIGSSLYALGRGFASLDSARSISYASQIMQSEFEKMRLLGWGTGTDGAGSGAVGSGVSAYLTTPEDVPIDSSWEGSSNMRMVRVASNAPGHTSDYKEVIMIKLTITWKTRDGRELSRSYVTYYGKNGLYDYLRT